MFYPLALWERGWGEGVATEQLRRKEHVRGEAAELLQREGEVTDLALSLSIYLDKSPVKLPG
jgi:hypothetical protein